MTQENGTQEKPAVQQQQTPAPGQEKKSVLDIVGSFLTPEQRAQVAQTQEKIYKTPEPKEDGSKEPPKEEPKKEEPKKEAPKAEEGKPAQGEEKKEAPKKETKEEGEEEVKDLPKSKFGLGKKKGDDTPIETPDQLLEKIRKDFGREDIKDLKDTGKFFEQTKDWRSKAQKVEEIEGKLKETEDFLTQLPESVIESMRLFSEGKDYTQPFKSTIAFDFSKGADKQDKLELVKHYFPNQFKKLTEDEIADAKEGNYTDKLETLVETATEKFNLQRQAQENQRAAQMQRAQDVQKMYKASVSSSVDYLKQSFPDVEKDVIDDAQSILSGGMKEIQKMYFNNDGTLKKEAAKLIMLAKHGEEEMKRLELMALRRGESKANEDILTRGADTVKPKKTGNSGSGEQKISKEVQRQISELGQGYGQKKTF